VRTSGTFASGTVGVSNTADSTDVFSEKLNVGLSVAGGSAQVVVGTFGSNLLAAGGTNSGSLKVSLVNPGTAGVVSGTVLVSYSSDGFGTSGLGAIGAGSQTLTLSGDVYRVAVGTLSATSLNLGNIRAGGVVGGSSMSVSNVAYNDNYSDLLGVFGSAVGGFTLTGGTATLSAGSNATVTIGYTGDVTTGGVKNGTLSYELSSVGQAGTGLRR